MLAISRTPPFSHFQDAAGNATFHINTTVVGLELVAGGGEKPPKLNINWTRPKEPRQSVEQTKQFILLAILAHVVDSFDVLLRDYADLDWLGLESLRELLGKSATKPGGKGYSISERTEAVLDNLGIAERDALSLLALGVAWRNSLAHTGRARQKIPDGVADYLTAAASRLSDRYAAIDIEAMLVRFSKGDRPTLKDATTLVAASQNLARALDEALIRRVAGTTEQLLKIVRSSLARAFKEDEAQWKRVWGRDPAARARALLHFVAQLGITETSHPVSAALESGEIGRIALVSQSRIATADFSGVA